MKVIERPKIFLRKCFPKTREVWESDNAIMKRVYIIHALFFATLGAVSTAHYYEHPREKILSGAIGAVLTSVVGLGLQESVLRRTDKWPAKERIEVADDE